MNLTTALAEVFHPFIVLWHWFVAGYRYVVDHLTKTLGIMGATLFGADLSGYLEGIKAAALKYLPPAWSDQISKKMGIALFVLVILRGFYTGWKAKQKAQTLPPPDPSAVIKLMLIALLIGTLASTCIAFAAPVAELQQ